jgi:peptidoglycan/xylan/chitin deacetylase (PgdA/CDA1 family)
MEIGSHSCSHPWLQELDEREVVRELSESRAALQRTFGVAVDHFCYPFGKFTTATVDAVRRCGYASAVTAEARIARRGDDVHQLPRLIVDGRRGLARFLLQVATPYEEIRQGRGLGRR